MTDPARIARELSEAAKAALVTEPWSMMAQYDAGILGPLRLGLLETDGFGHRLTPLGLSVAQHIKDEINE